MKAELPPAVKSRATVQSSTHSSPTHRTFVFIFIFLTRRWERSSPVDVLVEYHPALVVDTGGDGHQRLDDVRDLEHGVVHETLFSRKLQVDFPDVRNAMVAFRHVVKAPLRHTRKSGKQRKKSGRMAQVKLSPGIR